MATVPYYVYGMIMPDGKRTETEPFEATMNLVHQLADAKGDAASMFCYGWIRAGKILVESTKKTKE